MDRIQTHILIAAGLLAVSAFADTKYEMTSRITGGSVTKVPLMSSRIKEPHTTTHYIKGNKMAIANGGFTRIYDLDAGNVTTVNTEKKTYSVMTFEQMKAEMDEAVKKMHDALNEKKKDFDYSWKVDVADAGDEKEVAGFDAHHYIVTMNGETTDPQTGNTVGTRIVIDNWMAKEVAGMKEAREFNRRMAEKMGIEFSSSINPMAQAELGKGWRQASKALDKMDGFTVYTLLKTTNTLNGQDVMVSQSDPSSGSNPSGQVARDEATGQAAGRVPGGFGGLAGGLGGGMGRKKKADPQPQGGQIAPNIQMIMTIELTSLKDGGFDSTVFEVPAGFKQVEKTR